MFNNELSNVVKRRPRPRSSNGPSRHRHPLRKHALQDRLEILILLELTDNGGREYHTLTLRGLYDYVIKSITNKLKSEQPDKIGITTTDVNAAGAGVEQDPTSGTFASVGRTAAAAASSTNIASPDASLLSPPESNILRSGPITEIPFLPSLPEAEEEKVGRAYIHEHSSSDSNIDSDVTGLSSIIRTARPRFQISHAQQQQRGQERGQRQSQRYKYHTPTSNREERSLNLGSLPALTPAPVRQTTQQSEQQHQNYDHKRLGGYLHPRDMRRLVTPFSSSNEPELIVRRHVMLLNFDPLRAIVLRDKMLLLVPDGADSILIDLERRVRGGINELEKQVFGDEAKDYDSDNGDNCDFGKTNDNHSSSISDSYTPSSSGRKKKVLNMVDDSVDAVDELATSIDGVAEEIEKLDHNTFGNFENGREGRTNQIAKDDDLFDASDQEVIENDMCLSISLDCDLDNEWDDIEGMNWIEMPFELQSVDAVLASVVKMLTDDSSSLRLRILTVMEQLRGGESGLATPGDHTQDKLRLLKDEVKEMESRVQGFVRAMNQILDDEEDMALMNLSRIVAHPERFMQPVPEEVLNEESDEPELILEAYLQQSLSEVNALELLKGQILNTEELVSLQMDTIRNRLLFINTFVSMVSLCVAVASMIGSVFGMNLINHLEDDEQAFAKVVIGTMVGMLCFLIFIIALISRAGLMPKNPRKVWHS